MQSKYFISLLVVTTIIAFFIVRHFLPGVTTISNQDSLAEVTTASRSPSTENISVITTGRQKVKMTRYYAKDFNYGPQLGSVPVTQKLNLLIFLKSDISQNDCQTVINFFQSKGFSLMRGDKFSKQLVVSGKVENIQNTLHIKLNYYKISVYVSGHDFFAPNRDPSVDLDVPILGIDGLSPIIYYHGLPPKIIFNSTPTANVNNSSKIN